MGEESSGVGGGASSSGTVAPANAERVSPGDLFPRNGSPKPRCARSHQPQAGQAPGPDHLVSWLSQFTVPLSQSHFLAFPSALCPASSLPGRRCKLVSQ